MDAEVRFGVFAGIGGGLPEPGGGHDDGGGGEAALLQALEGRSVGGVGAADVVGMEDQDAVVGGEAEAFSEIHGVRIPRIM